MDLPNTSSLLKLTANLHTCVFLKYTRAVAQHVSMKHEKKERKDAYLKSLPILLPRSGIPGSGHMLCPWDAPTCVTTKQKNSIYRGRIEDKKMYIISVLVMQIKWKITSWNALSKCYLFPFPLPSKHLLKSVP